METSRGFSIRQMTRAELALALEWAAEEGWNPGLHDAGCFHATDPQGFLIAHLDGEAIGCISAVAYDEHFGFLGLYIVRPTFRGRGYGRRLWQAAIDYLGARTIGLDGVLAQQDNYKKSGFHLDYRNIRFQGLVRAAMPDGVVELSTIPFDALCAYDRALFPAPRQRFLRCWLDQPQAAAFGVLQHGSLAGYGLLRRCRTGYKIGPLFADNPDLAEDLFQALAARAAGAPIFLDVPEPNQAALSLTHRHGMQRVFETARMYTRQSPILPADRVYGVTTFELG